MTDLDDLLSEPAVMPSPLVSHLRDYQRDADESIEKGWAEAKTQLFVMATGTGKTLVMASAAARNHASGGRTLILCHMDELIEQARKKFIALTGLDARREKAQEKALLSDKVVVASIQTLARDARLCLWPANHFSLVIGDEAHLHLSPGWLKVLEYFKGGGARILGCTATAERGDKQSLGKLYERMACDYSMLRAVRDGWLVRPMVKTLPLKIDIRPAKIVAGDVDVKQTSNILEPMLGVIAAEIWKVAATRKVLVFMPSVDTSEKMAKAMREVGFAADFVSGQCPDRVEKIDRYRRNETRAIVCAMLLSTGWDCDDLDVIVVLRPTKISSLFRQMVGRGTRPLNAIVPALQSASDADARRAMIAASAKPELLLLDPLWVYENHDLAAPACLVARNAEEEKMLKGKEGDLLLNEEAVQRDFLDNLRKEIAKNKNRRAAMIDPLALAVAVGDVDLANYEPKTLWDLKEPTAEQLKALEAGGIESAAVRWRGQADRLLDVLRAREQRGLCSVRSMNFLKRLGVDATLMPVEEATRKQRTFFATRNKNQWS